MPTERIPAKKIAGRRIRSFIFASESCSAIAGFALFIIYDTFQEMTLRAMTLTFLTAKVFTKSYESG
jgi:hypothetical protein